MPLQLVIVTIAFIGNLILSVFTFFKNPKSWTNKLFFLFSLALNFYLVVNFLSTLENTDSGAFFYIKLIMSVAVIINLAFFLLTSTFPNQRLQIKPMVLMISILTTVLLVGAAQLNLVFTDAKAHAASGNPGPFMPFFLLHTILLLGGGAVLLFKKLRSSEGVAKKQIQFFLFGAVFMFMSIVVTNILFVLILNTGAFIGLLPLYTLVFVGSISYAIVKHRFLDIRAIFARTLFYLLVIFIIGGVYSLSFFFLSSIFFSIPFSLVHIVLYASTTFVVAFSFQWIRGLIQKNTDAIFFKGSYVSQELLKEAAQIMSTNIILERLTTQILEKLLLDMRVTRGCFIIFSNDLTKVDYVESQGYDTSPEFAMDDLKRFIMSGKVLIFEELDEGELKQTMRSNNVAVVLPLLVQNSFIGLLTLGEKAAGDIFSEQDISVLEILAPHLSVAIQNSKEYEEIKKFNVTLREEVDKATDELKTVNVKLQQLDKLKDDFVSVASHELRTPMTAIKSYLWMALNKRKEELTPDLHRYLDRAYSSVDRLINLVNDMLNVSRIESGRISLDLTAVDLIELSKEVADEVAPKANERKVTVNVETAEIPQVFCDKNKVHEVLLNLIGNSLKFTPENGHITIRFAVNDQLVQTAITDTGRGISAEDLPKLFSKFGRLDNSYIAMAESSGTGLGLYITKSIIEMHHGIVKGESLGVDKGSTFSFTLPIVGTEVAKALAAEAPKDVVNAKPLEHTVIGA